MSIKLKSIWIYEHLTKYRSPPLRTDHWMYPTHLCYNNQPTAHYSHNWLQIDLLPNTHTSTFLYAPDEVPICRHLFWVYYKTCTSDPSLLRQVQIEQKLSLSLEQGPRDGQGKTWKTIYSVHCSDSLSSVVTWLLLYSRTRQCDRTWPQLERCQVHWQRSTLAHSPSQGSDSDPPPP